MISFIYLKQLVKLRSVRSMPSLGLQAAAIVNIMLRKEVLDQHDGDICFSSSCLQENDVAVAHWIIRPVSPNSIVNDCLILPRTKLLEA